MTRYYSGSDAHDGHISDLTIWQEAGVDLTPVARLGLVSPSWVTPHPVLPLLYATQETDPGAVVLVNVAADGLSVRQTVASQGGWPCHLALAPDASGLVVSNYADGVVCQWSLEADGIIHEPGLTWQLTGSGPVAERQERSHAHATYFLSAGLLAINLGADQLCWLDPDGSSRLAFELPPGFGPRHLVAVGCNRYALVGELSSQVALIELTAAGGRLLDLQPTTTAPDGQPSGIAAWRDQVVVATRRSGSFTRFQVAADRLVRLTETALPGQQPRAITVVDDRVVVSVQDQGQLACYPLTGELSLTVVAAPDVSDFGPIPDPSEN
jgi:6-phosphogluconolactonase (cycloisomerase 2 family)